MRKANVTKKSRPPLAGHVLYSWVNCMATSVVLVVVFACDILIDHTILVVELLSVFYAVVHLVVFLAGVFSDINNFSWTFDRYVKLRRKVSTVLKTSLFFGGSVALYHIAAVLFGAAFFNYVSETFHFALLLSVITALPGCFLWGCDTHRWLRLVLGPGPQTAWEHHWVNVGLGTVVGAWAGAFVIPLDWDRPWQVWPTSCVYGALAGHFLGNVFVLVTQSKRSFYYQQRKQV